MGELEKRVLNQIKCIEIYKGKEYTFQITPVGNALNIKIMYEGMEISNVNIHDKNSQPITGMIRINKQTKVDYTFNETALGTYDIFPAKKPGENQTKEWITTDSFLAFTLDEFLK